MEDLIIGSIPLLIATFFSLLYYKKLKPDWLRLFAWYLVATFVIQTSGYAYSAIFKKSNHFIFNSFTLIQYCFYLYVFYLALLRIVFRRIALVLLFLFVMLYIYNVFGLKSFFIYNSLASNIGELFTLLCCFLYLIELLMIEDTINYFTVPMFWITTGIMLSAVGNFLYLSLINYILENHLDPDGTVYGIIMTSISIIEYGFFTMGFLCKVLWEKTR